MAFFPAWLVSEEGRRLCSSHGSHNKHAVPPGLARSEDLLSCELNIQTPAAVVYVLDHMSSLISQNDRYQAERYGMGIQLLLQAGQADITLRRRCSYRWGLPNIRGVLGVLRQHFFHIVGGCPLNSPWQAG